MSGISRENSWGASFGKGATAMKKDWYGWAAMTKSLGEIKELARTMRAMHKTE
ncbi:MAG: hypothetical protein HN416_11620 [Nitrospina sp.]|nr:hypothetical protein [Nitrospina sp.]